MRSVELHRNPRRRGLTLIELVVVVAILVALAGIVIPLISGMIGRAETSARATNSGEIYKAIQLQNSTLTRYPKDWDALTDGTSTALTYIPGLTAASGTTPLQVSSITAAQAKALSAVGITRLQLMKAAPTSTDITFNPYLDTDKASTTGALTIDGTAAITVVTLTTKGQFQLNLSDNDTTSSGTYVVVGFGKRCSLVGSGVAEAPVNFYDDAEKSPNTLYARYGVVFQVSGRVANASNSTTIIDYGRAKLVRVFRFSGTLGTGDDAIKQYWDHVTKDDGA